MTQALRLLAWTFALLLLAMPVVAVVQGWIGGDRWPIRMLALQAPLKLVDEASLRNTIAPLAQGGFFAVDPIAVRTAVSELAWVDQVDVRKRWPDRLEVRVTEHRPYAVWGQGRLVSEGGRLFATQQGVALHLPQFDASDGRVADLLAFHREARPVLVRVGDDIQSLRLSARGGWTLTTSHGLSIELGRHNALQRLSRFARLLPTLRRDPQRRVLERADLRYTNGFALSWAAPAAAAPAAAATALSPA